MKVGLRGSDWEESVMITVSPVMIEEALDLYGEQAESATMIVEPSSVPVLVSRDFG